MGDSFQKYYGFSSEEAKTAIEYYREYYTEKGILENTLYDGIEALLKRIKTPVVSLSLPRQAKDSQKGFLNTLAWTDIFLML